MQNQHSLANVYLLSAVIHIFLVGENKLLTLLIPGSLQVSGKLARGIVLRIDKSSESLSVLPVKC